ncbi:ACT domain-containing protein [Christensenellaceae bacterium NSJ-44]|uniref:ACT domain-containing protein n=1 Tax=Luoshenia tenuis TaxID=2763654 RepID=A0A926D1R6_9FIRM|nr:ACT domain-containing protein [Luoshenia tenuis]MBC8530153.1 ACT domain-containing protein [Luoshenia tenuis]
MVKQLSVFLENKPGRLAKMTRVLGQECIDIITLSISDTTNFGIVRAIVNNTDKALDILKNSGFTINVAELLAVYVPDHPGGLAELLALLEDKHISVEYLYSFVRKPGDKAMIVFKVEDVAAAEQMIREAGKGIQLLDEKSVTQA